MCSTIEHGVLLEVEGSAEGIERFMTRLVGELPPLASVDEITAETLAAAGEAEFRIAESSAGGTPDALITPDSATCADCLRELLDPADRRYRYPFIELHELRAAVHDRARRALRPAADDDGRLHDVRRVPGGVRRSGRPALSRPAECVPGVRAPGVAARRSRPARPRRRRATRCAVAARRLADGAILAVKGLGGYHLACDAANDRCGRRAARPQAPGGQAVRADGA